MMKVLLENDKRTFLHCNWRFESWTFKRKGDYNAIYFDDNQVDLQYKLKSIELALDHIITVCKHHKNLAFDVEESFYDKELYELDPEGFHENCLEIFKDVSEDTVDSIKSLAQDAKKDIRRLNLDFDYYAKPF